MSFPTIKKYSRQLQKLEVAYQEVEERQAVALQSLTPEQRCARTQYLLDELLRSKNQTFSSENRVVAVLEILQSNGKSGYYAQSIVNLLYLELGPGDTPSYSS